MHVALFRAVSKWSYLIVLRGLGHIFSGSDAFVAIAVPEFDFTVT